MKKSRFTEEQIIAILREQEAGMKTADVCRKHGISPAACVFYGPRGVEPQARFGRSCLAEGWCGPAPVADQGVGGLDGAFAPKSERWVRKGHNRLFYSTASQCVRCVEGKQAMPNYTWNYGNIRSASLQ